MEAVTILIFGVVDGQGDDVNVCSGLSHEGWFGGSFFFRWMVDDRWFGDEGFGDGQCNT